jgi:hypothetical protein
MRSIDALMTKRGGPDYQCAHFVRDAWIHLTGDALPGGFEGFLLPVNDRTAPVALRNEFKQIQRPSGLCVAMFRRVKGRPHTGLWYNGRILELVDTGPRYVPLHIPMTVYNSVRFYEPVA